MQQPRSGNFPTFALAARADLHHRHDLRRARCAGGADPAEPRRLRCCWLAAKPVFQQGACSCARPDRGGRSPARPSSPVASIAAALSRLPLPWRSFRLLRWALGAAIVFALAHIGHSAPAPRGDQCGRPCGGEPGGAGVAALMAMFGAYFTGPALKNSTRFHPQRFWLRASDSLAYLSGVEQPNNPSRLEP